MQLAKLYWSKPLDVFYSDALRVFRVFSALELRMKEERKPNRTTVHAFFSQHYMWAWHGGGNSGWLSNIGPGATSPCSINNYILFTCQIRFLLWTEYEKLIYGHLVCNAFSRTLHQLTLLFHSLHARLRFHLRKIFFQQSSSHSSIMELNFSF